MKKLISLIAAVALSSQALAYQTITSEATFNSMYGAPSQTVDFSHLKDGSTISNADFSPLVTSYGGGTFSVRAEGWANGVEIGSTAPGCGCAWTATSWNGYSISPTFYSFLYLAFTRSVTPFSVISGGTFIGFVPDSPNESYFLLGQIGMNELRLNYQVAAIPEPQSAAMMLAGLAIIGAFARLRRRYR